VHKIAISIALFHIVSVSLWAGNVESGEKIFSTLCWGCHHPTAEAFGPSFRTIAQKRTENQIKSQILRPDLIYRALGYKRNSMPSFVMSENDLNNIAIYIMSFK